MDMDLNCTPLGSFEKSILIGTIRGQEEEE